MDCLDFTTHRLSERRVPRTVVALVVLLGTALGVVLAPRLGAQEPPPPTAEIDIASASTPVLASPVLDLIALEFPISCAIITTVTSDPPECDISATFFFRPEEDRWQTAEVDPDLGLGVRVLVPIPDVRFFEYYLEVTERNTGTTVSFPYDGASGPMRLYVMPVAVSHDLPSLPFGSERAPDSIVTLPWGSGPGQVGVQVGDEAQTLGPQGFDVSPSGTIYVLDQLNDRVVLVNSSGQAAGAINVQVGPLGDLVLSDHQGFYVLDTLPAGPGSVPLVHRFSAGELTLGASGDPWTEIDAFPIESVPSPEDEPVFLTVSEGTVWVYGTPSDGWRPVMPDVLEEEQMCGPGCPGGPVRFSMGMPTAGGELLRRVHNFARVDIALASDPHSRVSLTPPSDRFFGELALVERLNDGGVVMVVRTWEESPTDRDHHEVIRLSPTGEIVEHFAVANSEYAQFGSLSQFRIGGDGDLYQLWTDETGLQLRRFELGL